MSKTPLTLPTPIVSTTWLAEHLGAADVAIIDASWYLPASKRDPEKEYADGHIPGALFWDLDKRSAQDTPLPHMMPDPKAFAAGVSELGISNDDAIVVYDGSGANLSAARVWWMFRAFGHDRVSVLDGGFARWRAEGHPIDRELARRAPSRFIARFRPEMVRSLGQVRDLDPDIGAQLIDARSRGRFEGVEPEPRPGLRSGHIPGAHNLPYVDLVGPDGTLRSPAELAERFRAEGVDLDKPIITSCGSGVSACAILLALELLGHERHTVYDGSWAEWGARSDVDVETGPATS